MTFNESADKEVTDVVAGQVVDSYNPIPADKERPCFVVLDESYESANDCYYRAGVWYFGIKPGRGDDPPTLVQQWICSPLHVDAVTYDTAGGNFGRLLRFRNTLGKWGQWAMPMEMLRSDAADLRGVLLSMGVHLDTSNTGRQMLVNFLQSQTPSRQMEAVLQTGWAGSQFKAYAMPDCVIGPNATRVTFQSEAKGGDEYNQRGTLDGWQQSIGAAAVNNPMLMLALCAAFAGPVLALVGVESGGLHLIGDSSTGKTTALQAAASVWGGDSFRRSWRTTANGLEGAAALFNDSLLALDEISECDPRDVGEVIYMLGNGRGKQRASRLGVARTVHRWRASILSTGERSIEASMLDAGQRVKAGQAVRLLDIPVQRRFGAWDELHQHNSGPAFSDALKRASLSQYGTAGRAFLEKLTRDSSVHTDRLESIKNQLIQSVTSGDGQPARAAARLAVLALAGELATSYGITTWPEGAAIQAAIVGFKAWQSLRGDVNGNAEQNQIIQAVLGFIERHGDSRFSDAAGPYEEHVRLMVRDRAGWWQSNGESREYWFTNDGMREALKGFDFGRGLDTLRSAQLLIAPPSGAKSKSQRIHGRFVRIYKIRPDKYLMDKEVA